MATRGREAEPVTVEVEDDVIRLTLDDGEELTFDLSEFECALMGEQAPSPAERVA